MNRPHGMLPKAFEAFVQASTDADVPLTNIVQTVGDASASAGFHHSDGTFLNNRGEHELYTAATDLSVRHPHEMSKKQVSALLIELFRQGFCPFWRHEGAFMNGPHIHMVWADCKMKPQLQGQVRDFLHGRNGLVSHSLDSFWTQFLDDESFKAGAEKIREAFLEHNS